MRELLSMAIYYFAQLLTFLIFLRAILSWFPEPRMDSPLRAIYYGLLQMAHTLTEPIITPIRDLIRRSPLGGPGMMLDFSPIIAIILIRLVSDILRQLVWSIL